MQYRSCATDLRLEARGCDLACETRRPSAQKPTKEKSTRSHSYGAERVIIGGQVLGTIESSTPSLCRTSQTHCFSGSHRGFVHRTVIYRLQPNHDRAFSIALLLLLLFALYVVEIDELVGERQALLAQTRRHTIIGWALALPAIVERVAIISVPSQALRLAGLMW